MKVITITSFKGGVGKSVTAIHLATYFCDAYKVLLVDEDQNQTAQLWASQGKLPFTVVDSDGIFKQLEGHDLVIRDKQANKADNDIADLSKGADLLILPCIPDLVSIRPVLETAKQVSSDITYRVLITIAPPLPNRDAQILRDDLKANNVPVFNTSIRRSIGYSKAAIDGVPIRDIKDSRARIGWRDYQNLGKEIEEILG